MSRSSSPTPKGAVFVYDQEALMGGASGWLGEDPGVLASVRGRLYRSRRGRLGLVPDPSAPPVRGRLVELTPPQMPVLNFLFSGTGSQLVPQTVEVIVNLRIGRATSWVLSDLTGWRAVRRSPV